MHFLKKAWQQIVLFLILAATGLLSFYGVSKEGYGNTYYAAAVKSMLMSWHNFFFVSFDPGGFVSIDKPPLDFWLQAASAKIFGFYGWSLILPQALAAVVAVAVIFHLVRRRFGRTSGLVAAAALALTPVLPAVARTNEVDATLALVVLLAAWALILAVERSSLPLLLLAMGLVGVGFNVKMLEAFMVLPAFYAAYWFGSSLGRGRKMAHLAAATAVLLVISLSWAAIVDMTPAQDRPYVGSSQTNSELELALGYNGIDRVLPFMGPFGVHAGGGSITAGALPAHAAAPASRPDFHGAQGAARGGLAGFAGGAGAPGIFRLLDPQMAGQVSWLLPLAFMGALGIYLYGRRAREPDSRTHRPALVFWGLWVLPMAAYFSIAGFFHTYYMVMMAPGLAALVGIGLTAMYRLYRDGKGPAAYLLPVALATNAAFQIYLLSRYPGWNTWLDPAAALAALAALVLGAPRFRPGGGVAAKWATAVGMAALLAAPAVWAATPMIFGSNPAMPSAGPELARTARLGGAWSGQGGGADAQMIAFLEQNAANEKYLVAVPNAMTAAPIILQTGKPVMAVGGFMGRDPILSVARLQQMVASGEVRYFLVGGFGGFQEQPAITNWVEEHGTPVPAQEWGGASTGRGFGSGFGGGFGGHAAGMTLYDLAPHEPSRG